MVNISLYDFIDKNRDELIRRCRGKVAKRSSPLPTKVEIDHGVPLFLEQLSQELRQGPSKTDEINKSAMEHGHDLLLQGFTISQVVYDYGDVCQSVTDLAVETNAVVFHDWIDAAAWNPVSDIDSPPCLTSRLCECCCWSSPAGWSVASEMQSPI